MKPTIDFILLYQPDSSWLDTLIQELKETVCVKHLYLVGAEAEAGRKHEDERCTVVVHKHQVHDTKFLRHICNQLSAKYTITYFSNHPLQLGYRAIERMMQAAEDYTGKLQYAEEQPVLMLYSDRRDSKGMHPTIDYQIGSLRDDFDFGSLRLYSTSAIKNFANDAACQRFRYAAEYALRLYIAANGQIVHLREPLYTETETDKRASGAKQFDYVDPSNREVQIEMEKVCTEHLKRIGAWLAPDEFDEIPVYDAVTYPVEASVIIPVRNRVRTICDAVNSALEQQTTFAFNVIVIDNHSTDGTTEVLKQYQTDKRVIVITPQRTDLGIGGCWDLAIRSHHCGKYAVQLDSDDLYSNKETLTRIIDAFYHQRAAMVIGSYRMVNFSLETLPPGLISHAEWTPENGRNNALRINGLGAPRAFRTDILRQIGFPNTSYGEDYALGLAVSRHYRIGRIYDELYLCRRWEGNSDAALDINSQNRNNAYKDELRTLEVRARQAMVKNWNHQPNEQEIEKFVNWQLSIWEEANERFKALDKDVQTNELPLEDGSLYVQFNPSRIVSTGAKVDKKTLKSRPCFLCEHNRPDQQRALQAMGTLNILVNPYPILPRHLTLPTRRHVPQNFKHFSHLLDRLAWQLPNHLIFYNGARCGASAPDHAHLQAGSKGIVPIERDWKLYENHLERIYPSCKEEEAELEERGYNPKNGGIFLLKGYACPAFVIQGPPADFNPYLLEKLLSAFPKEEKRNEPDVNILSWRHPGGPSTPDYLVTVVFARRKHRPDCYFAKGKDGYMISPGAIDMGGLIITPREEDFKRLTPQTAQSILREVTLTETETNNIARKLHGGKRKDYTRQNIETTLPELVNENVCVGILQSDSLEFTLNGQFTAKGELISGKQQAKCIDGGVMWNGNIYSDLLLCPSDNDATFTLDDVTIGIDFHWEKKESQTFKGNLRLIVDEEKLVVINEIPVEDYLESVISSEMNAHASVEFLKTHAVVSRSWIYSQMLQRRQGKGRAASFFSFARHGNEFIRWHDRSDHTLYDVCADDHCQRYQGITRATLPNVHQAIKATQGEVLMFNDKLCDARFSKCCGGISEKYSSCWDDTDYNYLQPVRDNNYSSSLVGLSLVEPDLTNEQEAEKWIRECPPSYCHTNDTHLLKQVLNDYDQSTTDYYRWKVELTQTEILELVENRTESKFGAIIDLKPVKRGASGRLIKLHVVGKDNDMIIGKELEIRRLLSKTHLYSSAFIVERHDVDPETQIPGRFVLIGAGWGHGVGMCQIGAAVMASQGFNYQDILTHYYPNSQIKKL